MIRVLIAEDEPPIQRQIRGMIERLDASFEVAGLASDGEQALELLAEAPFDLVLTDIRMPVMSGLTLMEILRERYPDVMVCVLSGYGSFEYTSHALRAQAVDYLLKPLSEGDLAALLARIKQEHLRRRRLRLTRTLTQGINKPPIEPPGDAPGDEPVLLALFRAQASYWDEVDLDALVRELLGTLSVFTWVFMGDAPEERVLILEARPGMAELIEYTHEYMLARADVSCACLKDSVALPSVRQALYRLSEALRREGTRAFALLEDAPTPAPDVALQLAERVRDYLDAHYPQHITNQTLSEQFGYVPSYIALLFRRSLGVSPTDYLNSVRLERAKQLMLDDPGLMVKQVAERVGFKNQYHFSKAFKRYTGQWPTDYKGGERGP